MGNTLFTIPSLRQRHGRGKAGARACPARPSRLNRAAGFTMMEVMTVVFIVGIMAAMAAPSISSFIAKSYISSASNDLIADLMFARISAASIGQRVVVCGSTDGANCDYADATGWQNYRIIFVDTNNDGIFNAGDSGYPTPLKSTQLSSYLRSNLTVTMSGFPGPVAPSYTNNSAFVISYYRYGGMSTPSNAGIFKLCVSGTPQGRTFKIDYSGRPLSPTPVSCP